MTVAGKREMLVAKGTRGQGGLLVLFSFVNEKSWCTLVLEVRGMGWSTRKKPMYVTATRLNKNNLSPLGVGCLSEGLFSS